MRRGGFTMTFKEKLVILRKARGLTQDEFASAVGVSRQAVYKWESGQSYPEVPKLLEMKLLFTISIDDLLDDSYDIPLPEKKKRKRMSKETIRDIENSVKKELAAPTLTKKEEPKKEEAPIKIATPVIKEIPVAPKAEEKEYVPVIKEVERESIVKIPSIKEIEATPLVDVEDEEEIITITPATAAEIDEEESSKKVGLFGRWFGRK